MATLKIERNQLKLMSAIIGKLYGDPAADIDIPLLKPDDTSLLVKFIDRVRIIWDEK